MSLQDQIVLTSFFIFYFYEYVVIFFVCFFVFFSIQLKIKAALLHQSVNGMGLCSLQWWWRRRWRRG